MPKLSCADRKRLEQKSRRPLSRVEVAALSLTELVIEKVPGYAVRRCHIRHRFVEAIAKDIKDPLPRCSIFEVPSRKDELLCRLLDFHERFEREPPWETCKLFGRTRLLISRQYARRGETLRCFLHGYRSGQSSHASYAEAACRPELRRQCQAAAKDIKRWMNEEREIFNGCTTRYYANGCTTYSDAERTILV